MDHCKLLIERKTYLNWHKANTLHRQRLKTFTAKVLTSYKYLYMVTATNRA